MAPVFLDQPALLLTITLLTAFLITLVSIPSIIEVARAKHLYDEPNGRTSHTVSTPTLGGMAIYAGLIISSMIFVNIERIGYIQYIIAASIIIFFIGLKDDILTIAPFKKLIGQIIAAAIIIDLGDVRFTNLHGFLGFHEIGYLPSALISLFVIIVTINAFNQIDGIDGLASGIGMLVVSFFGIWFYLVGHFELSVLSAALVGSLMAFFRYNVFSRQYKIFMGDIGSLTLGFFIAVLLIRFNEINVGLQSPYAIKAAPVVSFGVLILPMFDTLRVFIIRISRGNSPFKADKLHMHHRIIALHKTHFQASMILITANAGFIVIALLLQNLGMYWLGLIILSLALFLSYLPVYLHNKQLKANKQLEAKNEVKVSPIKPSSSSYTT